MGTDMSSALCLWSVGGESPEHRGTTKLSLLDNLSMTDVLFFKVVAQSPISPNIGKGGQ